MKAYDCIVAGTGGAGSAALYHLARRGARALGIDRFPPGHDRGSSHGETRIIRLAYYEHPDYVPLLARAYELWNELEVRRGEKLLHRTGLLQVGPAGGKVISGVLASARRHALDVDSLDAREIESRYRGLRVPEEMAGVLERNAGYLRVEACVRAHAEEAVRLGAEIQSGETISGWRREGGGYTVTTDRGSYAGGNLVIAPGAWATDLLAGLHIPLVVVRKPLLWLRCEPGYYEAARGFPAFLFETPAGLFYGFPQLDEDGLKVAEHSGGEPVADPLAPDRSLRDSDVEPVTRFLGEHLPHVAREVIRYTVCLYTMSPDAHFVVDRHPEHEGLAFAAGLSGHGFKFTSALGEALAELALDGKTRARIEFLSARRPGLAPAAP